MDVVVLGTGRVAHALAHAVAGLPTGPSVPGRLVGVTGRSPDAVAALASECGVDALPLADAVARAGLLVVAVSDDQIAAVASGLAALGAPREGAAVVHVSGATSRSALAPLTDAGWRTGCWHPLQAFPDTTARVAATTLWTITADADLTASLTRLTAAIGGRAFPLADEHRAAYHAAAALAVAGTVTAVACADAALAGCGLPRDATVPALTAMVRGSLDAVDTLGPAHALTGPLVRGDVGTVARHRTALRILAGATPDDGPGTAASAVELYDAASRAALALLRERGVPADVLHRVEQALTAPPR